MIVGTSGKTVAVVVIAVPAGGEVYSETVQDEKRKS